MCSSDLTRDSFRQKLRSGELNEKEVEIPVAANSSMNLPTMDIPGMPGSQMGMINLGDVFGKNFGKQKKMKKMTVSESHDYLLQEETEKLLDQDLPDDYIEQYCPFCGEEYENLDDDMDAVHWEDED